LAPSETNHESASARGRPRRAGGALLRPGHVRRARAVASLARDRQLRPRRRVAVLRGIVVLLEVGRVALRALVVPGLPTPGPVQGIRRPERLTGMEMHPALTALPPGSRVPGDPERLETAVGKRHQVLLEGPDPEGVGDLELAELAVRTVGADQE